MYLLYLILGQSEEKIYSESQRECCNRKYVTTPQTLLPFSFSLLSSFTPLFLLFHLVQFGILRLSPLFLLRWALCRTGLLRSFLLILCAPRHDYSYQFRLTPF